MDKPFVIIGEASESEDDEQEIINVIQSKKMTPKNSDNKGVIVAGEASESDSECEDTFREAFFARSGATKNDVDEDAPNSTQYETLLHKKLRECNLSLYNNMSSLARESLITTVRAINSTNQHLVVSQIQIQDAASALGKAFDNMTKLNDSLSTLFATPYIPEINIT